MLAPAVMISACGLLLLGINNKYSLVIGRIRELRREKRAFRAHEEHINPVREQSIDFQLSGLGVRLRLLRNTVVGFTTATAAFVMTSFAMGLMLWVSSPAVHAAAYTFFIIGMACVFIGALFSGLDAWQGYTVVQIEMAVTPEM